MHKQQVNGSNGHSRPPRLNWTGKAIGSHRKSNGSTTTNGYGGGGTGENRFDARFKVLILGNSGVGKTSLMQSIMNKSFRVDTISTIGIDLTKKIFQVDNHRVQLEIWDTAGQEQYHSIVSFHFREAKAFIMVYDITDRLSFEQIRKYWLRHVDQYTDDPIPVFFVGNKADLSYQRVVTEEEGNKLANQQCAHGHFETSAKSHQNIEKLFQSVATSMISTWGAPKRLYEVDQNGDTWEQGATRNGTVRLEESYHHKRKVNCCVIK